MTGERRGFGGRNPSKSSVSPQIAICMPLYEWMHATIANAYDETS